MSNKIIGNVVGFVGAKYDTVTLQAMYNEVIEPSPEQWFTFDAEHKAITGLNILYSLEYASSDITDLVFPYQINGITVENIGNPNSSYYGTKYSISLPPNIEDVRLPNCVRNIYACTFMDNVNMKTVNIPTSCYKIDWAAFEGCSSLENVITPIKPNYELHIEPLTFSGCGSLNNVDTIIDGIKVISEGCFVATGIEHIIIPESVDVIENDVFNAHTKLKSITILNPKCAINPYAFAGIYDEDFNVLKDDLLLKGYKNSTAETYAKENGFKFIALDDASSSGDVDLSNYYTKYEIDTITGNIDTALEEIIAIQNQLMGVSE